MHLISDTPIIPGRQPGRLNLSEIKKDPSVFRTRFATRVALLVTKIIIQNKNSNNNVTNCRTAASVQ